MCSIMCFNNAITVYLMNSISSYLKIVSILCFKINNLEIQRALLS